MHDVDPNEGRECECRVSWALVEFDDGVARQQGVFCSNRNTATYIDIWGNSHAYCPEQGHEIRVKSVWPEKIQRMLFEDVKRQESLMTSGKAVGGSLRAGVPITDDSDYLKGAKRGVFIGSTVTSGDRCGECGTIHQLHSTERMGHEWVAP
jgi:hypothetical protein